MAAIFTWAKKREKKNVKRIEAIQCCLRDVNKNDLQTIERFAVVIVVAKHSAYSPAECVSICVYVRKTFIIQVKLFMN
jgi:hypothetical protein